MESDNSTSTQSPANFLPVLDHFVSLLSERFAEGVFTSEDAIRYTFFHALTAEGGYSPRAVTLEEPLPHHRGRRIDTVVYDRGGRRVLILEFKYHRIAAATQPKPQLAGGIFRDLFRLAYAQATWRSTALFVYATDAGMADYLRRPRHGLDRFFDLAPGQTLEVGAESVQGRSPTFVKSLEGFLYPGAITCVRKLSLPSDQHLRVYSVEHKPAAIYRYE